jgi:hypothetical protein
LCSWRIPAIVSQDVASWERYNSLERLAAFVDENSSPRSARLGPPPPTPPLVCSAA